MGNRLPIGAYEYATLDIETDVNDRFKSGLLMQGVARKGDIFVAVAEEFVEGIEDPAGKIESAFREKLPDLDYVNIEIIVDNVKNVITK
ncbi:MAG TPA: hypothetical protein ENL06_03115, partial [Candidatus Portnoybacteria bacterium]|nr:hypothetical protein [Candidatus Portnoybacteria bacterium]